MTVFDEKSIPVNAMTIKVKNIKTPSFPIYEVQPEDYYYIPKHNPATIIKTLTFNWRKNKIREKVAIFDDSGAAVMAQVKYNIQNDIPNTQFYEGKICQPQRNKKEKLFVKNKWTILFPEIDC